MRSALRTLAPADWLLLAFALLNAVLYASLLPLWEGFDEPFHYSLVREYARLEAFPAVGRSAVEGDVVASLSLVPLSHLMVKNLGGGVTFDEYFRLPAERRAAMRSELAALRPGLPGGGSNYEAQQAPLAYLLMSVIDRFSSEAALPERVWRLRIFAGAASAAGCALALFWMAALLDLPPPFRHAAAFIGFSSQMFYATVAHVTNDFLTLALFLFAAAAGAAFVRNPSFRLGLAASALAAAALLTKASMLAVVPWLVFVLFLRLGWRQGLFALSPVLAAVPWYARNLAVYGNLSGMHEFASPHREGGSLAVALSVPWPAAIVQMARQAVWTGNNSFTPMSRDLVFALLALAVLAAVPVVLEAWRRRLPHAERLLWPLAGLLAASLAYAICVSYWFTGGRAFSAGPWYAQPLALLLSVLFCAALARARLAGRLVSSFAVALSASLLILTWWVKFFPFYAGVTPPGNSPARVWALYRDHWRLLAAQLGETAMTPAAPLFVMALLSSLLAIALAASIVWRILRSSRTVAEFPSPQPDAGNCRR